MANQKLSWADLFERDQYAPLISEIESRGPQSSDVKKSWEYFVGALAFSGKILQARALLESYEKKQNFFSDSVLAARFFLAVGLVRQSHYSEARTLFAQSLMRLPKVKSGKARFFIFQGVAFFRYFCGHYRRSAQRAELSYTQAFKADYKYGKLLSLDLLGYARCQTGSLQRGLADLEEAQKIAEHFGNHASGAAHAVLLFRAAYGLDASKIEEKLRGAIESPHSQNVYSKSALRLELSKHLVLRGKGTEARAFVDTASADIYKNSNLRQSATLHLRYAHSSFLEGHSQQALLLLKSARMNLNPQVDTLYIRQLEGLERQILKTHDGEKLPSAIKQRAEDLVGQRIQRRRQGALSKLTIDIKKGEDPLGDLLDLCEQDFESAVEAIAEVGYWGLVPQLLKLAPGSKALIFDLHKKSLCLISGADVEFRFLSGQGLWQKLALVLAQGFCTKEQLISRVWGLSYHPLRHDPLLYSAIAKLRKFLGAFGHWIEWNELGYRLRPGVVVLSKGHFIEGSKNELAAPSRVMDLENFSQLNHRQIQALGYFKKKDFMSVKDYSKLFSISQITACRDLASLVNVGRLLKAGRARATRYYLPLKG